MGETSKIAWTDGTFNIAWGCTEVGPGCDNCYARELAARFGVKWGVDAPRRYFGDKHWNDPIRWNRKAEKAGKRMKVFCSSMADIFDLDLEAEVRSRLWDLIEATPWIDWQLCTKRIGNAKLLLPIHWQRSHLCPQNVWMGITVVNQQEADRDIPKLLQLYGFKFHWLSIEPQLDEIFIERDILEQLDWIVVGGESGTNAREFKLEWARSLHNHCVAAGVPFFMKQLGCKPEPRDELLSCDKATYKWDEPQFWPADLRIREFPT